MTRICSSGPNLCLPVYWFFFYRRPGICADVTVDCSGATPGAFTTIGRRRWLPCLPPDRNSIAVSGTCTENVVIVGRTDLGIFG